METYSYRFDAFGKVLHIYGDWAPCLKDLLSWYTMPTLEKERVPELALEISRADRNEIQKRIPLPEEKYKTHAGVMLANEKLDYTTYAVDHRLWTDYAGAGRIFLDFEKGAGISLIQDNAIFPTYQKYLFADHPLNKLFSSVGIFSMHASCVAVHGKGIAFTGNSGAGKSTAAFALIQKNLPILTDEKLFVRKDQNGYVACSISNVIKVNQDTLSRFFSFEHSSRVYDVINNEHYLKIGNSEKSAWQNRVPLAALCLLEQTGKPETEITSVRPTKLIGGLFPVTISGVHAPFKAAKFDFIMDMLEKIECRWVKFGTDMDDFARKIEALAETL